MAKTRPPYTPECRRQMVELVRAGRSPEELAQEFEPTAQSIRNWIGQAECDVGRGGNGLTTAEREELNQLRRENRQLRLERDILSKAAAWFARETNAIPSKGSGSFSLTNACSVIGPAARRNASRGSTAAGLRRGRADHSRHPSHIS
jgi:transposase